MQPSSHTLIVPCDDLTTAILKALHAPVHTAYLIIALLIFIVSRVSVQRAKAVWVPSIGWQMIVLTLIVMMSDHDILQFTIRKTLA